MPLTEIHKDDFSESELTGTFSIQITLPNNLELFEFLFNSIIYSYF